MIGESVSKSIIIDIPFNINLSQYMSAESCIYPKLRRTFAKTQTSNWIERRLELFMKYTCNSLRHQTNQDFCCLLRCTPETQLLIDNELGKYPKLPENIRFTSKAQEVIEHAIKINDYLYHVVIDSDNMYHPAFVDKLSHFNPRAETQTILCQEGYIFDDKTGQLASIFHQSPSFYAAVYNKETYHDLYQKRLFERHWNAVNYPYEVMSGRNYCICTHDLNVDNAFYKFNKVYKRRMIEGEERERILEEWHLADIK